MDLVNTRQKKVDSLNEQYPIEGRPAEAAVLIRSAVIKLERAKRQLFNLKNRFSYTTKHKKRFMPTTRTCFQMQLMVCLEPWIMLTLP
jgi:hypothetical protein